MEKIEKTEEKDDWEDGEEPPAWFVELMAEFFDLAGNPEDRPLTSLGYI